MENIKYLDNGVKVKVIEQLSSGNFLVSTVYTDNFDNICFSLPYIVDYVYDVPPLKQYHESVNEINKCIEDLQLKYDALDYDYNYKKVAIAKLEGEIEYLECKRESLSYDYHYMKDITNRQIKKFNKLKKLEEEIKELFSEI